MVAAHCADDYVVGARLDRPAIFGAGSHYVLLSLVIIGVDLDGVCADVVAAYRRYVASFRGVDPETLGAVRDYNFSNWGFDRPLTMQDEFYRALEQGMALDMPPIAGVSTGLKTLAGEGIEIRIITGRLVRSGMYRTALDTISWMRDNEITFNDLCFVERKTEVCADVYIDDNPSIINTFLGDGRMVLVFDQPYNQDLDERWVRRARSWPDLTKEVLGIYREHVDTS